MPNKVYEMQENVISELYILDMLVTGAPSVIWPLTDREWSQLLRIAIVQVGRLLRGWPPVDPSRAALGEPRANVPWPT